MKKITTAKILTSVKSNISQPEKEGVPYLEGCHI